MTVDTLGRTLELYRRSASERSAIALVIANAIPLIGVLVFGWSLLTILVLFWLENGIVGFWNVPRIILARQPLIDSVPDMVREAGLDKKDPVAAANLEARLRRAQGPIARVQTSSGPVVDLGAIALSRFSSVGGIALAGFFLVHYGMFWFVHGIFVFALPTFFGGSGAGCLNAEPGFPGFPGSPAFPGDVGFAGVGACASPFGEVVWSNVALAGGALFLSHGASFFLNYLGKREYLTTSPIRQVFAPYGRVVVLHLTILIGAFVIAILGAPIAALVVLVVLKTALDLRLHLRQRHHAAEPAIPVLSASG
jgi:hypothetical protein